MGAILFNFATVWAKVFPSYMHIITKVMETIFYSSKKEGKDTCQSILGYVAKYPKILFYGCCMLEKLNQDNP